MHVCRLRICSRASEMALHIHKMHSDSTDFIATDRGTSIFCLTHRTPPASPRFTALGGGTQLSSVQGLRSHYFKTRRPPGTSCVYCG